MTRTMQGAQATQATTTDATATPAPSPRQRRGRGRRRVGAWVRPVYPIKALYEAASEEERRQAHTLSATILEYWTGLATKQEIAKRLCVPPIRVWQISQRAAAGLVCGLLKPPSGRRGPPMRTGADEKALLKEIERLRKENALQRELIEVLRELPGNRDREIKTVMPEGTREAEASPPRKAKSKTRPRALPEGPAVASPPSS